MRFFATVLSSLVLLSVESALVKALGLSVARIDVTVVLVVFLAVRGELLEGALSAFAVGYLLDVMSGQLTGLYVFLAMLTFLAVRLGASLVEVRSVKRFALVVAAADFGHGLLALFFTWLTSKEGALPRGAIAGLPLQVALTAGAALLMWPLLRKVDPGADRPEAGALR